MRAQSDVDECQASTQPPRTAPFLSANEAEEEVVTKARALRVIRKVQVSRFGPGSCRKGPSMGQLRATRKALKKVFSHSGMNLTLSHREYWYVFACGSSGAAKHIEEGREQTKREGQVEFRAKILFCKWSYTAGKPNCLRI